MPGVGRNYGNEGLLSQVISTCRNTPSLSFALTSRVTVDSLLTDRDTGAPGFTTWSSLPTRTAKWMLSVASISTEAGAHQIFLDFYSPPVEWLPPLASVQPGVQCPSGSL